jgi:hypothetical protein
MTKRDHELITMLSDLYPKGPIGGRESNVDWMGKRPKDRDVTLCVRISLRDRDRLVRVLKKNAQRLIGDAE